VPGAGGTQRLPRIIGIAAALDLLVSGRSIGAEEARSLGLVDLVVQEGPLLPAAKTFAHHIASRPTGKSQTRDRAREEYLFDPSVFQSFEKENMETFRGYLAPQAILRCVEAAASLPLEAGLEKERREFELLVQSPHSLALRHLFFADRQAFKLPFQVSSPDKLAPAITLLGAVDAIPDQLPSPFKAAITRAGLTLTSAVTDDSYLLCMGTDVEAALMRHKPTAQQPLFVLAPEANENFPVLLNENSDALFGLVPLERNGVNFYRNNRSQRDCIRRRGACHELRQNPGSSSDFHAGRRRIHSRKPTTRFPRRRSAAWRSAEHEAFIEPDDRIGRIAGVRIFSHVLQPSGADRQRKRSRF